MPSLLPNPLRSRDSSNDPDEYRLTLIEHLTELRDRVVRSLVAVLVGVCIGWFIEPAVYNIIDSRVSAGILKSLPPGAHYEPAFRDFTGPFMLQMRLSCLIGFILVTPYLITQIWGFVSPGLKSNERKPFRILAPFSVILFFIGGGFCWYIMPQASRWFVSYLGNYSYTINGKVVMASLLQEPGTVVFFTLKMIAAFGIGFQLPIVVYGLALADLLSAETLTANWRQAATGIFVAAMIITPSNDLFSMLMMAIPLVILFGVSVVAVRFLEKQRKKLAKIKNPID